MVYNYYITEFEWQNAPLHTWYIPVGASCCYVIILLIHKLSFGSSPPGIGELVTAQAIHNVILSVGSLIIFLACKILLLFSVIDCSYYHFRFLWNYFEVFKRRWPYVASLREWWNFGSRIFMVLVICILFVKILWIGWHIPPIVSW